MQQEYILVLLKPDALEAGREKELLERVSSIAKVTFYKRVLLSEEEVRTVYPDKVGENFFPMLLEFLTSAESLLIIGKGCNAGSLATALKDQIRADVLIDINERDLVLLQQGNHPRQEEITHVNALRNLIHVSTEDEGAVKQICSLLGEEYL